MSDEFEGRALPPVAIAPLGTGNDLARSLGFGAALTQVRQLKECLRRTLRSDTVELDQWKVTLRPKSLLPPALRPQNLEHVGYFQNYFSVGMDAMVAQRVGEARQHGIGKCCFKTRCPWPCSKVHGGICCYGLHTPLRCCWCASQALNRTRHNRPAPLEVHLDGSAEPFCVPEEARQFTLTNLNSYGAGMTLFADGPALESVRPNDGRLEVWTLRGPPQMVRMAVSNKVLPRGCAISGCGRVSIMAQPSRVEMELQTGQFFQMDGEGWVLNEGCKVIVEHHKKVRMLCPPGHGMGAGSWEGRQNHDFWVKE
mmetsp:Transcript_659/g.1532  ORF Transcript_659/g.1532 Transcript_659/m.1532 type:complete len:311 (+) Transcript_659:356-1288(+)